MLSDSADFVPATLRERIAAAAWRFFARIAFRPMLSPRVPFGLQRWWMRQLARFTFQRADVTQQGGTEGGISGEWMRPFGTAASPATILYLHGGGYCVGSHKTHRAVTSHLAGATGLPLFVASYRLAPEHTFPAAV